MPSLSRRLQTSLAYYGGLQSDAKRLVISDGLAFFPFGFLFIIQSIYLKRIAFDETSIGLLYTVQGLSGSALVIPLGILADRYGRKKFMLLGLIVDAAAYTVFVFTADYFALLGASFGIGLGTATYYPPWNALIAQKTPDQKRTVAFSLTAFLSSFLGMLGALISITPEILRSTYGLSLETSYRLMFLIAALVVLAAALPILRIDEGRQTIATRSLLPRKSLRSIGKFSFVAGLIGFGAGFIIPLFSLWFYLSLGLAETALAPLFAIANATTAISFLAAPRLADRIGTVHSIGLTSAVATVLLVLIPLTPSYLLIAILFIIRQFLMNMSSPVQGAFTMSMVDREERAAAAGITGAAWNISNAVSPTIGGYLMQYVNLSLPFYFCGFFYTLAIILIYIFYPRMKPVSVDPTPRP